MACRAVLFAITEADVSRLLEAKGDDAVLEIVDEIEEEWDERWLCQLDKAWDALHRCFTDGELGFDNGAYPLNHALLGGRQLYTGEDYIIALVLPQQVADVAQALQAIDEEELEKRYWCINRDNYGFAPNELCAEDLEYMLSWFAGLKPFYAKAAASGHAVIFTVDQ
jgi:hypothetical protein